MKQFFRSAALAASALLVGVAATAQAQTLPNGTLDNWVPRNGVDAPANWLTSDDLLRTAGLPITSGAVSKTTDVHGGTFAARLETKASVLGELQGVIVLGNKVNTNNVNTPNGINIPGGLDFTARPTQMQFYYKLSAANVANDQPLAAVELTRTVNGSAVVVGSGSLTFTATASAYTLATVPITYSSTAQPDSIHIAFSSGEGNTITPGTVLQIDDVTLSGGLATRAGADVQARLNVAPNPAPAGRVQLSSPAEPALAAAPLAVLDVAGRVVLSQPAQPAGRPARELDLGTLPAGIYTLRLDTAHGPLTRKLVTQ